MKSQKWPLNRNYLSKLKTPPQNDFQIHTISQTVWILVSSCVKEKKIVTHQYQVLQKWTTKPQLYLLNFRVDCSQYDCEVLKRSHPSMHLHVLTKRKFLRSGDHSHYDERELRTTPEERWKTGPQFVQGVFLQNWCGQSRRNIRELNY